MKFFLGLFLGLMIAGGAAYAIKYPAVPAVKRLTPAQANTCLNTCMTTHFPGIAVTDITQVRFDVRRNGEFGDIKHVDCEVNSLDNFATVEDLGNYVVATGRASSP